jgi:hypothetical protein
MSDASTLDLNWPAPAAAAPLAAAIATPGLDALREIARRSTFDELADRYIEGRSSNRAPFGITRKMLAGFLNRSFVAPEELAAMTYERAKEILKSRYWDTMLGDKLPPQVAAALFDVAVRRGVGRANKTLQKALVRLRNMALPVNGAVTAETLRVLDELGVDNVAEQIIAHRGTLVWRLGDGKLLGHDIDVARAVLTVGKLALRAKLGGLV